MKLEQIKRLNAERTQGEWVARKTATNPRKQVFDSYSTVDAEFANGTLRDICRSIYTMNEDANNAAFFAAAPLMADILTRLADFKVNPHFICMMGQVRANYNLGKITDGEFYQAVIDQLREEIAG